MCSILYWFYKLSEHYFLKAVAKNIHPKDFTCFCYIPQKNKATQKQCDTSPLPDVAYCLLLPVTFKTLRKEVNSDK
jgi:hypothetical protein